MYKKDYYGWKFYKAEAEACSNRYDILAVSKKDVAYELYTNAPFEIPILENDDGSYKNPLMMTRKELKERIRSLKAQGFECSVNKDVSYYPDKWQRFYSEALPSDDPNWEYFVDQIEINLIDKEYFVLKNADMTVTNGYDVFDEVFDSSYVSRKMLDFLVEACEKIGLKNIGGEKDEEI